LNRRDLHQRNGEISLQRLVALMVKPKEYSHDNWNERVSKKASSSLQPVRLNKSLTTSNYYYYSFFNGVEG